MESQPQNPEFRNNPENFHPCIKVVFLYIHSYSPNRGLNILFEKKKTTSGGAHFKHLSEMLPVSTSTTLMRMLLC